MKNKFEGIKNRIQLHINEIDELLSGNISLDSKFFVKKYEKIVTENKDLMELVDFFDELFLMKGYNGVEFATLNNVFTDKKGNWLDHKNSTTASKIFALSSSAKKCLSDTRAQWEYADVKITALKELINAY